MNPRRRLVLAAAAAAPLAACTSVDFVAPPAGVPKPPSPRPGQRWRFDRVNLYNGLVTGQHERTVVEVAPQLRVAVVDSQAGRHEELFARPWDVIESTTFGDRLVFDRPMPLLPPELAVGSRSSEATHYRLADSDARYAWQQSVLARGWERVHVPAGEFEALRIERTIWFDHHDMFRLRSYRTDWLWYVPELDHWVRREWTGRYYMAGARATLMYEDWVAWRLVAASPGT